MAAGVLFLIAALAEFAAAALGFTLGLLPGVMFLAVGATKIYLARGQGPREHV